MQRLPKRTSRQSLLKTFAVVLLVSFLIGFQGDCQEGNEKVDQLYNRFGDFYKNGRYKEAEETGIQLVKQAEIVFGKEHLNTAIFLNNLATVCKELGKYEDAELHHQRALRIREEQLEPDDPSIAISLNNIGELYRIQGRLREAEPLYKRALEILEKQHGVNHPETAPMLNNLALLYGEQGKYEVAEPLYQRTLAIREKQMGPDHPTTATSLNNLAALFGSMGKYEEAEPLYKRALAIREKQLGASHPDTAKSLGNLAGTYKSLGKLEEALPLYQRALEIIEERLGADHPDTATSLNNLAGLYKALGKYTEAEPLFKRALSIREANNISVATSLNNLASPDVEAQIKSLNEKVVRLHKEGQYEKAIEIGREALDLAVNQLGADHSGTAFPSSNLAELYRIQGKYEQAGPLFERALAIREKQLGPDHLFTASSLNSLAVFYNEQGKFKEAEPLYRRALAIYEKQIGADHPFTAQSINNLAAFYFGQGDFEQAEALLKRSLAVLEKHLGADHPNTAQTLSNLALVLTSLGKYDEAEPLYDRALRINESQLGTEHPTTAQTMDNLASFYVRTWKVEKAEPLFLKALAIRETQLGADHLETSKSLNNLGFLYQAQGKLEKAEPLFLRALAICEEKLGAEHPSTASYLTNLADLYSAMGKREQAEPLVERSLAIRENQLGRNHPDTATSLNSLAELYLDQGRYEEAEPLFLRSLGICVDQLGENHSNTATALNNLAFLYGAQGRAEKSGPLLERALAIREKQLGIDHPDTASSLESLGLLNESLEQYEKAESFYQRALAIREAQLGADHPYTANSLNNLSGLYLAQAKQEEAEPLILRALQSSHEVYKRQLRYFSSRDCLALQNQLYTQSVAGTLSVGRVAALEQIWFKGAVLEALNARRVVEEGLRESEAGMELLSERKEVSQRYSKEVLTTGAKSTSSRDLEQQLGEIEKKVSAMLEGDLGTVVGSVDLTAVQSSLSGDSVLVESFRYAHRNKAHDREDRYSSALIRKEGEPVYVAHGNAESIEKAVSDFRKAVSASEMIDRQAMIRSAETTIQKAYLAPLEEHLNPGQSVIFSLDSQLHFLPVGMIRNAEGLPFGQKYKVRYVASGRDLVKETTRNSDGNKSALVLGNPSYRDNQPLRALADAEEEAQAELVATNLRSGMRNDAGSLTLTPLPGTAREIAELGKKLKDSGYTVTSLSQGGATEEALEQALNGHDIVHLATHGFFLSEIERETNPQDGLLSPGGLDQQTTPVIISDPMYRSGLALAGAQSTFNLWKEGKVPPPSKDGILLAAEANLLNLRGTDLVVLSACETASGEALDGEGVMGLRRAFASAGANNTIMTLWPVNDEATVEVMDAFYDKYLSGTHPAIALAEVQNELYQPFVEKYGEVEAIARLAPFVCMSLGKVE